MENREWMGGNETTLEIIFSDFSDLSGEGAPQTIN